MGIRTQHLYRMSLALLKDASNCSYREKESARLPSPGAILLSPQGKGTGYMV